jgi:hypothetical protein
MLLYLKFASKFVCRINKPSLLVDLINLILSFRFDLLFLSLLGLLHELKGCYTLSTLLWLLSFTFAGKVHLDHSVFATRLFTVCINFALRIFLKDFPHLFYCLVL